MKHVNLKIYLWVYEPSFKIRNKTMLNKNFIMDFKKNVFVIKQRIMF